MRLLIFLLLFFGSVPGPIVGVLSHVTGGGGSCSGITGTYTDCFTTVSNPLANPPYTVGTTACGSGYDNVKSTGSGAAPATALNKACAIYTSGTFGSNQTARVIFNSVAFVGVSGPCIHANTGGNMYCYLINLGQVWVITGGGGISPVVSGCPGTSGADTHIWKVSNVGNTITCADETAGTSASGTDSTYTGSGGYGGFIIDESGGGTGTQVIQKFGAS